MSTNPSPVPVQPQNPKRQKWLLTIGSICAVFVCACLWIASYIQLHSPGSGQSAAAHTAIAQAANATTPVSEASNTNVAAMASETPTTTESAEPATEVATQTVVATAASTNTPIPTSTSAPTSMPEPTATATPTATSAPTVPPVATATAQPTPDRLAAEIMQRFGSKTLDGKTSVSTAGNVVTVQSQFDEPPTLIGEELTGIALLTYAELHTYIASYVIFHDFDQVDAVHTTISIAGAPVYQARATRQQAYDFPRGELDLSRSPEADVLYSTAIASRMIHKFDVSLDSTELAQIVANPNSEHITSELENWVSGVDISAAAIKNQAVNITLDLTDFMNIMYPGDDRNTPSAEDFIEDQMKMNAVNTLGSLFDRFPNVEAVTVKVMLDSEALATYTCSRATFERIGRERFITATTLEDNSAILDALR